MAGSIFVKFKADTKLGKNEFIPVLLPGLTTDRFNMLVKLGNSEDTDKSKILSVFVKLNELLKLGKVEFISILNELSILDKLNELDKLGSVLSTAIDIPLPPPSTSAL